jgi:Ca2+-binding EF-hand superfamily protein
MVEFNPDNTKYNEEFEITKDYKTEKGSCVFSKTTDPPGCRHSKDRSDNSSKWDSHATPRSLTDGNPGCLDMNAENFDDTASSHDETLCKYPDGFIPPAPFDKDGDGGISEEEFIAGAAEMGISESEAKKMFDKANADGKGGLSEDEFLTAFGAGAEELREACFEFMRDPKFAYHSMDKNGDGLLSPDEWKAGLAAMEFTEGQADRLFRLADTNDGENTQGFISRYEFWTFLAYRPHRPHFKYHWNTYYGDLDRWGYAHQKHNQLEHATAFLARLQ